jgi:hypothetical protein
MLDYTFYPKLEKEYLILKAELKQLNNKLFLLKMNSKPFDFLFKTISLKTDEMNGLKLVLKNANFI